MFLFEFQCEEARMKDAWNAKSNSILLYAFEDWSYGYRVHSLCSGMQKKTYA